MTIDDAASHDRAQHALPYHRLALASPATARWWRPLAFIGTSLGLYAALTLIALVVLLIVTLAVPTFVGPSDTIDDPRSPADMLFLLGSLALLLPAITLGSRWGGRMRGAIHSVAGRVRWRLLFRAALVIVPFYTVVHLVTFVINPPADFAWPPLDARTGIVIVIVLLLTPLQCAAEEYTFRALPQQALGTWLRSPLWGIVLPVPLFILGHGYDWAGQIDLAIFSLCMGFLVWKSGGVELAIVVHTANNLILFLLAPLSASSLQQGAIPPAALLLSLPMTLLVTAALTVWVSHTHGLRFFEPVTRPAPQRSS